MTSLWKTEWRLFLRSPATLPLLIVLMGLTLFAALNGSLRVDKADRATELALAADQASYDQKYQRISDYETGAISELEAQSVLYAHKSVLSASSARILAPSRAELGVLSATLSRPTPDILPVGIQTRHRDQEPALDNPTNRLDGPFDLSFVTTWLVPLFVLLLSYDLLARDRELGRSALLSAQAGHLRDIVLRRIIIRFMTVFGLVGTSVAIATIVTELTHVDQALPALLIWLLGFAFLLGFWLCMAAGINASARNSASAGLMLLSVWVVTALLTPALISASLNMIAPPPDRLHGVLELRAIDSDLNQRRDAVSEAYYNAEPDNRPIRQGDEYEEYFVGEFYPRVLAFDAAYAPLAAAREQARVHQARTLRLGSVLSPSLALKLLSEDLAGGAPERRTHFLASADLYQTAWREHFDYKLASMRPLTRKDYADAPTFHPEPEPVRARFGRLLLLLSALAIPCLLAVAWMLWALRKARP